MAQFKSNKPKLGLMIVILVLSIALFFGVKLVKTNQENRSKAAVTNYNISNSNCSLTTEDKIDTTCIGYKNLEDQYVSGKTGNGDYRIEYRWSCGTSKCALKGVKDTNSACGDTVSKCKTGSEAFDDPNDLYKKSNGVIVDDPNTNNRYEYRWICKRIKDGYHEICTKKAAPPKQICTKNQKRCSTDLTKIMACDNTGTVENVVQDCKATGNKCVADKTGIKCVCTDGQQKCIDGHKYVDCINGKWESGTFNWSSCSTFCIIGQVTDHGLICKNCDTKGLQRCVGDDRYDESNSYIVCGDDYHFGPIINCPKGKFCKFRNEATNVCVINEICKDNQQKCIDGNKYMFCDALSNEFHGQIFSCPVGSFCTSGQIGNSVCKCTPGQQVCFNNGSGYPGYLLCDSNGKWGSGVLPCGKGKTCINSNQTLTDVCNISVGQT